MFVVHILLIIQTNEMETRRVVNSDQLIVMTVSEIYVVTAAVLLLVSYYPGALAVVCFQACK